MKFTVGPSQTVIILSLPYDYGVRCCCCILCASIPFGIQTVSQHSPRCDRPYPDTIPTSECCSLVYYNIYAVPSCTSEFFDDDEKKIKSPTRVDTRGRIIIIYSRATNPLCRNFNVYATVADNIIIIILYFYTRSHFRGLNGKSGVTAPSNNEMRFSRALTPRNRHRQPPPPPPRPRGADLK